MKKSKTSLAQDDGSLPTATSWSPGKVLKDELRCIILLIVSQDRGKRSDDVVTILNRMTQFEKAKAVCCPDAGY